MVEAVEEDLEEVNGELTKVIFSDTVMFVLLGAVWVTLEMQKQRLEAEIVKREGMKRRKVLCIEEEWLLYIKSYSSAA
jgi:hypothetical protein